MDTNVGGKIVEGMKMLEGRKRVSSPFCWSGICLQVRKGCSGKGCSVIIWKEGILY